MDSENDLPIENVETQDQPIQRRRQISFRSQHTSPMMSEPDKKDSNECEYTEVMNQKRADYKRVSSAYGNTNKSEFPKTRLKRSITVTMTEFNANKILTNEENNTAEDSIDSDSDSNADHKKSKKKDKKKDKKKNKTLKSSALEEIKKKDRKKKASSLTIEQNTISLISKYQKKKKNEKSGSLKLEKTANSEKSFHPKYHKMHGLKLERWQEAEISIMASKSSTSRWDQFQAKLAAKTFSESSESKKNNKKNKSNTGKDDAETNTQPGNSLKVESSVIAPVSPRKSQSSTINSNLKLEIDNDPRASKFEEQDNEDNIRYAQINGEEAICAGTIEKLIQKLTSHEYTYPAYLQCFMLTYRQFMTPKELIVLLKIRWNSHPPPNEDPEEFRTSKLLPIRLRILNIVKLWVLQSSEDILKDEELKEILDEFFDKIEGFSTIVEAIKKDLKMKSNGLNRELIEFTEDPPEPYLPHDDFIKSNCILDLHPEEVARQLALIEFNYFKNIHYRELLGVKWAKSNKSVESPNVLNMISFTNHFVNWTITQILKDEDSKIRSVTLSRFITIAKMSYKNYNNFNAAMEILSALQSSPIFRSKHIWGQLPNKIWDDFEEIYILFESDNNFKNYRKAVENAVPPSVPYLGRYLSELLFLDEKHSDKIGGTNLINFGKMYLISDTITQIQMLQSSPYCLQEIPTVQEFISLKDDVLDPKSAHQRSLLLEPRESERHSVA